MSMNWEAAWKYPAYKVLFFVPRKWTEGGPKERGWDWGLKTCDQVPTTL